MVRAVCSGRRMIPSCWLLEFLLGWGVSVFFPVGPGGKGIGEQGMDDECLGLGSPAYCVMAGMAEIRTTEIPQGHGNGETRRNGDHFTDPVRTQRGCGERGDTSMAFCTTVSGIRKRRHGGMR